MSSSQAPSTPSEITTNLAQATFPPTAPSFADGTSHQTAFSPVDAPTMKRSTSPNPNSVPKLQRLPVNARRNKVAPENRKRVAAACNECNVRRTKCSGERPCQQCLHGGRACVYPDRNDKTTVSKVRLDQLEAQSNELKQLKERLAIDRARQHDSASSSVAGSVTSPMSASLTTWPSNHGGNEDSPPLASRVLKDQDGKERSFGSTSGASFLQQIKEFVKTCQMLCELKFEREAVPDDSPGFYSDGMVQTEDSRPLPYNTRANPSLVPNNTVRTSMLNQFRYAIQDGNGDFDSGGIYYWANFDSSLLDERTDGSLVKPQPHKGLPPGLAIYHAAFAFNLLINPAISPAMPNSGCPADHWLEYFSRARRLVGNPLDTTESSKADIPALTLLSVFNVEMNRRDAAYMFISIATRLAIRDGVHCAPDQDEATIRAFWTLYILDRWLCSLMGRPLSIPDEAIRLREPREARGFPSPVGLKAHKDLAKICGHIVCETYGIAPKSPPHSFDSTASKIETAMKMLNTWRDDLPPELSLNQATLLGPDRPLIELHMNYNQLVVLTIRPLLLTAVKKALVAKTDLPSDLPSEPRSCQQTLAWRLLQECRRAARENLILGQRVRDLMGGSRLLSWSFHAIFNAALVLLLGQLYFDDGNKAEDDAWIHFAISCFDAEAQRGGGMYPRDCKLVLDQLRELVKSLHRQQNIAVFMEPIYNQGEPQNHPTSLEINDIINHPHPRHLDPGSHYYNVCQAQLYNTVNVWNQQSTFDGYDQAFFDSVPQF